MDYFSQDYLPPHGTGEQKCSQQLMFVKYWLCPKGKRPKYFFLKDGFVCLFVIVCLIRKHLLRHKNKGKAYKL